MLFKKNSEVILKARLCSRNKEVVCLLSCKPIQLSLTSKKVTNYLNLFLNTVFHWLWITYCYYIPE